MSEFEGESASTRDTARYCVEMARPYGRQLIAGAGFLVLGVAITDVATPLVFASVLDRIATLQPGTPLWPRFGTLILAYAVLIVIGQAAYRMSGWLEWEGSLRTFANGIHRSFERLLRLGYRWHIDHPSGEVASSLSAFSWALIDGIDNLHWGVLRIIIVVLSAVVVLAVVAWPVALVLVLLDSCLRLRGRQAVCARDRGVPEVLPGTLPGRGHGLRRDPQRHHGPRRGGRGGRVRSSRKTSSRPRSTPTCRRGGCSRSPASG